MGTKENRKETSRASNNVALALLIIFGLGVAYRSKTQLETDSFVTLDDVLNKQALFEQSLTSDQISKFNAAKLAEEQRRQHDSDYALMIIGAGLATVGTIGAVASRKAR